MIYDFFNNFNYGVALWGLCGIISYLIATHDPKGVMKDSENLMLIPVAILTGLAGLLFVLLVKVSEKKGG